MTLVSVIVPMFNASRTIAATIASVVAQTHRPIELIIVDDGSTDDSLAIAGDAAAALTIPCQVTRQRNAGAASARNHGLRLARGELIQFLDADDLLSPTKIAEQVMQLDGQAKCLSRCAWMLFDEHTPIPPLQNQDPFPHDLAPIDLLRLKVHPQILVPVHAWLTPRTLIERAGPWDEQLSVNDDGEYFARVLLAAESVLWVGTAFALYRQQTASLSRTRSSIGMRSLVRSLESVQRSLQLAPAFSIVEDHPRLRAMWSWAAWYLYPEYADESLLATKHAMSVGGLVDMVKGGRLARVLGALLGWRLVRRIQHHRLQASSPARHIHPQGQ